MKRMDWNPSSGDADAQYDALCAPLLAWLEELRPGRRLRARDGTPFIRTNRTCICFCNLRDGSLCSARDICRCYGGVSMEELRPMKGAKHGRDEQSE
ncbi:hypothetical protein [Pseudoduganella namucuonensis]|uniref:Uncharacterized protein n=1 Tax=Pseudoduganella namucuonensis TaxID=1035707 RepID=A0A1I7M4D0_9BURK|nr:hypothetical protein [Pseudoduganella namucuonensis]SFV16802.1 hypothetical protein SAMN05216552_105532 [Pseudoduganella namucuonensis]